MAEPWRHRDAPLPGTAALRRRSPAIVRHGMWLALALSSGACLIDARATGPRWICSDGQCDCEQGSADCDGDVDNGCEVDVTTDPLHCGACFSPCTNGDCDAGKCDCALGFEDCDLRADTGCEVDTRLDPHNCGECSHDCEGGACVEGVCQPAALLDVDWPHDLVVTSTHLHWIDRSQVWSLALDGTTDREPLNASAECLAAYQDELYWIHETELVRFAPVDTAPATIASTTGASGCVDIVVNAGRVCWSSSSDIELLCVPRGGGEPTAVAADAWNIATDESSVYWVDFGNAVYRLFGAVGVPQLLFQAEVDGGVEALAVDSDHIYLAYWNDSGGGRGGLIKRPKAGGDAATLLDGSVCRAQPLTAHASGLHFSCQTGTRAGIIGRLEPDGPGFSSLVDGQVGVSSLVVTEQHIYWTTLTQLLRLVR